MSGPLPPRDVGLADLLAFGHRHREFLWLTPAALALVTVAGALLVPRRYQVTATFVAQSAGSALAGLSGVAAQLGVSLPPGADQAESPQFYADFIESEPVLRALVETAYRDPEGRRESPEIRLPDAMQLAQEDSGRRTERAMRKLKKWMSTGVNGKTGVVSFTVEVRSPGLALGIANRTLEVLNDFNVHRRQTQAGAERRFVEGRLTELRDELHASEDKVQRFLQQNREFRNSPPLLFEYERLQREVATRQAIYTTLAESYERARINEVRDTPAITVLQAPRLPLLPQSRRLALKGVLAGLLGLLVAGAAGLMRDAARARPAA